MWVENNRNVNKTKNTTSNHAGNLVILLHNFVYNANLCYESVSAQPTNISVPSIATYPVELFPRGTLFCSLLAMIVKQITPVLYWNIRSVIKNLFVSYLTGLIMVTFSSPHSGEDAHVKYSKFRYYFWYCLSTLGT